MNPRDDYALRKAQLVAQCDLERLRIRFALGHIRGTLTAPVPSQPTTWARPVAAALLGFALPSLGVQRVKSMVDVLSMAVSAYRAVHNWRALHQTPCTPGIAENVPKPGPQ